MADGYRSASDLCLNADEVRLLVAGLSHWAGAARCSDEFAAAIGFRDAISLPRACWKISDIIEENEPLAAMDWARAILATEASFVSDLMGCGKDWGTVTGLRDEPTVNTLRSVQRKLRRTVMPLRGEGLGTFPAAADPAPPASRASVELINDLVQQHPALSAVLEEHLASTGGEIRPHWAMQQITRWLITHRTDEPQVIHSVLDRLESAYANSDDPSVRDVIAQAFVGWLPDPGQRGEELRTLLGPHLSALDPWSP